MVWIRSLPLLCSNLCEVTSNASKFPPVFGAPLTLKRGFPLSKSDYASSNGDVIFVKASYEARRHYCCPVIALLFCCSIIDFFHYVSCVLFQ